MSDRAFAAFSAWRDLRRDPPRAAICSAPDGDVVASSHTLSGKPAELRLIDGRECPACAKLRENLIACWTNMKRWERLGGVSAMSKAKKMARTLNGYSVRLAAHWQNEVHAKRAAQLTDEELADFNAMLRGHKLMNPPKRKETTEMIDRRQNDPQLMPPPKPPSGPHGVVKQMADSDLMPFGKYKGTPMEQVPASYFHWLWTNERDPMSRKASTDRVADYISRNLSALKQEHEDGIW